MFMWPSDAKSSQRPLAKPEARKNEWLKAIGPFGQRGDFWGSANAVGTASVTFPLTPALSLWERENPPLACSTTQRGVCPTNFPNNRTCRRLFPLPVGEGQGEGNQLAVRLGPFMNNPIRMFEYRDL